MISIASATGNLPTSARRLCRSRPATNSMVMNLIPSDSCRSKMRTTFLCATSRASSNSCLKRGQEFGFIGQIRPDHFESHYAVDLPVVRLIHGAHAAESQHFHDLVAFSKDRSGLQNG